MLLAALVFRWGLGSQSIGSAIFLFQVSWELMLFLISSLCHCVIIWESLLSFSKRQAFNFSDCEENLNTYLKCILIAQKQEDCIMQSIKRLTAFWGFMKDRLYRKWGREKATISMHLHGFLTELNQGSANISSVLLAPYRHHCHVI